MNYLGKSIDELGGEAALVSQPGDTAKSQVAVPRFGGQTKAH
jgi:hypothetical protein